MFIRSRVAHPSAIRNALAMPSILVRLERPHMEELFRRFRTLEPAPMVPRPAGGAAAPMAEPDDDVYFDPSEDLDHFVRRCIGTVTELEDFQQHGGTVLLAYPDGSMRVVSIDLRRDGMSLSERALEPPPIFRTDYRRRRRGWRSWL